MTTDRDLLDELAAVLDRVDPIPTYLAEAADFPPPNDFTLLTWLADSALAPLPGMRGGTTSRTLRFTGTDATTGTDEATTVDLHLDTIDGRGVHALGLVHPPRPGTVRVSWPHGGTRSTIDHVGWFQADALPTGPLHFAVHQPGRRTLSTGWFVQ